MIKKILFVLIALMTVSSFGGEFKGNYEEGYVEISVNKKIKYSFFPVYMDYELEEPYVGVKNLFALTMSTGMKIDREGERIYGKLGEREYEFYYGNTEYITKKNDIYIKGNDLSKVFKLKNYDWNTETYLMKITTEFITPYEIYLEQEENIKKLNLSEDGVDKSNVYTQERKLFTPGVLRPRYTNYGIDDNDTDGTLSVRYDTHMLYGDFTTTGFVEPDQYLGYTALTYNEVLEGKSIILGDSYMQTYDFLDSRRLTGLAVQNWNGGLGAIEVGRTSIRGFAPFNSGVELYRNGALFGFTRVGTDGSYEFENINIQNYNDIYTIKIYNFDGTIEIRQVSMLSGSKILKKGEVDYEFLIGTYRDIGDDDDDEERIDLEDKSIEGNIKASYGVTNNLTLGFDYINDLTEDRQGNTIVNYPTELIGANLYYTTGAVKYPTYFEFSEVYDMEYDTENRNTHIGKVRQRIGNNVLSLEAYQYSDFIAFLEDYENRYIVDWRASINRDWGYNLRYDNIDDFGETEEYLSASIYRNKNNILHELGGVYPYGDTDNDARLFYNYSNSNLKIFNKSVNLYARINSDFSRNNDDDDDEQEYDVRVGLKTTQNKKFKGGIYVDYNSRNEYEIGLEVRYKVYNWIEVIADAFYSDDDTDYGLGVDIEKTIILEKPFTPNSNAYPSRAWMGGKVFMDDNNSGTYEEGERVLEGVEVKVGRKTGITDEKGVYFIDNISSYEVEDFEVNVETLDPMLEAANEKKHIKLYPASGGKLDIPIQPISVIMGDLTFEGETVDGIQYFPIISQLYIQLKNLDGKVIQEKRLEPEGFYMLDKVLPGRYILEIDYRGEGLLNFEEKSKDIVIELDEYGSYYEDYNFKVESYEEE